MGRIPRIFVLILLCIEVSAWADRKNFPQRIEEHNFKVDYKTDLKNICDIDDRDAPLHCFCSPSNIIGNATKADCWVFTEDSTNTNAFWRHMANQPFIQNLRIRLRANAKLTTIPTTALALLKDLLNFTVHYANVERIHAFAFANLTRLTTLNLHKNQIVTLEEYSFSHLPNLTSVDLNDNRISELSKNVFVDIPNLSQLVVNRNNISYIGEGTFRFMSSLKYLELNYNYLSVLTKETFTGLSGLKYLDLSHNKINMLGDLAFSELWDLEVLLLEGNEIEFISNRAFVGLAHLAKITLQNNHLTQLTDIVFAGLPGLNHLDLRSNKLESLPYKIIRPLMHNFLNHTSVFQIEYNKFYCHCGLEWLHTLYNETKSDSIKAGLAHLKCIYEDLFSTTTSSTTTAQPYAVKIIFPNVNSDKSPSATSIDLDDYDFNDNTPRKPAPTPKQLRTGPLIPIKMKVFLSIPIDDLPCPERQLSTDSPQTVLLTPASAERINTSGKAKKIQISITLILVLIIAFFL